MSNDLEMPTEMIPTPSESSRPKDDPFYLGWRYIKELDKDGKEDIKQVPLNPDDLLHPEEDDFLVTNYAHIINFNYLFGVFKERVRGRPGEIAFGDMRIDWQIDDDSVFGPDISVFRNLNAPWDPHRGTFPVKSMGAETVVVIEITSPSTEKNDRGVKVKEYQRIGIPLYIIVDYEEDAGELVVVVYGYRMTPAGYSRIPADPKGIWIEHLRLWVRSGGEKVICVDEWGNEIPERPELTEQRDRFLKERDEARQLTEREKQRAEQEKLRAEESARKVAELEAELRRLRGEAN
jgi:colicin import membrane protein